MQVAIHLTHHMQGPLRTEPSEAECILALALFLDFRFRGLDAGTVTMAADACAAAVGPPGTLPAALEASLSLSQLSQPKPPLCRSGLAAGCSSALSAAASELWRCAEGVQKSRGQKILESVVASTPSPCWLIGC